MVRGSLPTLGFVLFLRMGGTSASFFSSSSSTCGDYSGIQAMYDEFCVQSACPFCVTTGDLAGCMEKHYSTYCQHGTRPQFECSDYSGTIPAYDDFCVNQGCPFCKTSSDPRSCMEQHYSEFCLMKKKESSSTTTSSSSSSPPPRPTPPIRTTSTVSEATTREGGAVKCGDYRGKDPLDDEFCSDHACAWCRSQSSDLAACMDEFYSGFCKLKDDNGVDPDGSEDIKPEDQVALSEVTVGAYYPNWFVYKKIYMGPNAIDKEGQTGQLEQRYTYWPHQMENLAPRLTHVYYAFMNVKRDCYIEDGDPDASWYGKGQTLPVWIEVPSAACRGAMNDMMSLKTRFPHLKLMMSLGGWTYSENFSACLKTAEGRRKIFDGFEFFVGKMDPNWGKYDAIWNGVDFDWEHPGTPAAHNNYDPKVDWENYVKLVTEFRTYARQKGRNAVVLSSAIGVGDTLTLLSGKPTAAKQFCESLDFVNIMTYDLHGKWLPNTGHNAQFCEIDKSNPDSAPSPSFGWSVLSSVKKLHGHCKLNKLSLGIPNYSPAWTGIPNIDNGLYQTSTRSDPWALWATFSDKDNIFVSQGILSYWDLKDTISRNPSFKLYSKTCPPANGISVPVKWVYNPNVGGGAFASVDDEEVVRQKTRWAKTIGMRGFFFWDAQNDRNGDLLRAGWEGWGLEGHEKGVSGSKKCYDDRKPDFDRNPDGSEIGIPGCHKVGHKDVVRGGEGCAMIRDRAKATCGSAAYPVGGERQGGSCIKVCTYDWGNNDGPQVGDVVHFICEGDPIPK